MKKGYVHGAADESGFAAAENKMHVVRIRHYSFLANVHRSENVALCRELLTHDPTGLLPAIAPAGPDEAVLDQLPRCPVCGIGVMIRIEQLLPLPAPRVDSS